MLNVVTTPPTQKSGICIRSVQPGTSKGAEFVILSLKNDCDIHLRKKSQIWLKIVVIWLNSSSQKIPGLMSYTYYV